MNRLLNRTITCPQCGAPIRIPWFWVIGIEGIFRCRACKMPLKTGYKMGAILSAVALSLSMASVQLLVYLFSIHTLPFFVLLLLPLWILIGFNLRKKYMCAKIIRRIKKTGKFSPQTDNTNNPPETEHPTS